MCAMSKAFVQWICTAVIELTSCSPLSSLSSSSNCWSKVTELTAGFGRYNFGGFWTWA